MYTHIQGVSHIYTVFIQYIHIYSVYIHIFTHTGGLAHTNGGSFGKSRAHENLPRNRMISLKRKSFAEITNAIRSYYSRYIFIVRAAEVILCYDWFGWLGSHKCSVFTTGFPSHLKPWVLVSGDVRGNCRDFRSVCMSRCHLHWQAATTQHGGSATKAFHAPGNDVFAGRVLFTS